MGTVGIVGDMKNESLPILSIYVVISKFSANGVEVMVIFMTCGQREYRG